VSEKLTLFALLGVADPAAAAERWPRATFLPGLGLSGNPDDVGDYEPLLNYLQSVLDFAAVRPGAAADRVGLAAEVSIRPQPNPPPLVLRELPDFGFVLQPTEPAGPAEPPRLFVTQSDAGVEVILEGLPVEITLPIGLLTPLRSEQEESQGAALAEVEQAGPFLAGVPDTFRVLLRELTGSSLFVHLRVRFTEEGEVVLEPAVPISIGRCRFSGLPCDGVHDLGFLPYPTLSGAHTDHELALEWRRHAIPGGLGSEGRGLITVRTLDLDHLRDPVKQLVERFRDEQARANLEFVLEDLALPVSSWLTPVATHGRFGLRRSVITGGDQIEAYDLTTAPIEVVLSATVDWRLKIFRLLFESPDTVVARLAVLFGKSEDRNQAIEIDVSDGWLLQGAWLPPSPVLSFTIANVTISLMTARLGLLLANLTQAQGKQGFLDHVRALIDIGVAVRDGKDEVVQIQVPAKPPPPPPPEVELGQDLVLRNLGWDLGSWAVIPSLWFPESLKLTAFEVVQLEVEEVAFLSEANGGRYLAFSGGVSIFPGAGDAERKPRDLGTPGVPAENSPNGGGIRFRRLRFRMSGNPQAPSWLLDGVTIFVRIRSFELTGSGTITDTTRDGHRFREFGLGLLLRFRAMGKDFGIGAQLFYGRVSGPVDTFTYWLFGLLLSYCPAGPYDLREIRLLVAGGMSPDLPEPDGRQQEVRLLRWYQQHSASGAVEVRSDRTQQRGGWKVERGAQAAGIGADINLSVSKSVTLRSFIFFHTSDSASGLLVAAEVFALKASKPIGFGAIEVDLDRDRWSAIIGVDLELAKLLDTDSPLAKGLGRLTGTIFAGNQPGMFAIGQLADQASWLTLSVNKSLLGMQARVSLAFCLQIAAGDGPRGFGLAVTAAAQGSLGIGKVQLYAALGYLVGIWGNEASSSGIVMLAEVALRIKVFWVFSFGASVTATFEQLGPQEPNYRRVSLVVRIETPWWMPDVTFRLERVRNTPEPAAMPVLSPPLAGAAALEPGSMTETVVASDTLAPAGTVLTINALRAVIGGPLAESVWTGLTPVSVDATLALDFTVAVGNETTVAPSTPAGAGRQQATAPAQNYLSTTYTLTRIGIRRRARFGLDAGVWTDLLAPADSEVGGLDDLLGDPDLSVTFASAVRFRWDDDVVSDDEVNPRRLLVNADTPFTFLTGNPAAEEGLLANDPTYPCCDGKRDAVSHQLDFVGRPIGVRAPAVMTFTQSTSTLRWILRRPPVVVPGVGPPQGVEVARMLVANTTGHKIAVVSFDEPAFMIDIEVFWRPLHAEDFGSTLVVEAERGLQVVAQHSVPMWVGSPTVPIHLQDGTGFTSVTLRYLRVGGVQGDKPPDESVEIRRLAYRTVREERDRVADQGRCQAQGGLVGGGKLAWLPNHDYEIAVTVRTTVDHKGSAQEAVVEQRAGFRTRGLPGLNAVAAPGTELEPYVESIYPGVTRLLYRREPIVLGFDERFSSLLPVDRDPQPGDPAERTQLLEWVIAVEQGDGERLSVPTADWIVSHRGTALPPRPFPWIIDDVLVHSSVRRAAAIAPLMVRLEALADLSPACTPGPHLHSSQVLTHAPVGTDPAAPLWPARTTLRAAVREKGSPFVARRPFVAGDETALTVADEGQVGATGWQVLDGSVAVVGDPAAGVRHYAIFGEPEWTHLQLHAELDPAGGAAGLAVAVGDLPQVERALVAMVDEVTGRLVLLSRRGAVTIELAAADLPGDASAPYPLDVFAFDDRIRAQIGATLIEADRGDLRDGRAALVLDGPGRCHALHIDGLDGYRTQLATSRFPGFSEHIASWDGVLGLLPGEAAAVPGLLAATGSEIAAVMAPGADAQVRQRLFDRWIAELIVPLSPDVSGLRLHALGDDAGIRMLVLESPEPLPFAADVRLQVSHLVIGLVDPPPDVPRPLLKFAGDLTLEREVVSGPVLDQAAGLVGQARTLVHSIQVERPTPHLLFRVYRLRVTGGPGAVMLSGELIEERTTPVLLPGFPPRPLRVPADHIALLSIADQPLTPPLPLPVERRVTVDLVVLTNSIEDRALLIPTSPLAPDAYTFDWTIDRVRFRSPVVDNSTRYREVATFTAEVG
jgi:hypothetical protein